MKMVLIHGLEKEAVTKAEAEVLDADRVTQSLKDQENLKRQVSQTDLNLKSCLGSNEKMVKTLFSLQYHYFTVVHIVKSTILHLKPQQHN